MLVLSRRESDQVLIPSLGITLEVLSIKGNVVKLGIAAPQDVRILRGEVAAKLVSNWGTEGEVAESTDKQPKTSDKSPLVQAKLKNDVIAQREIPVRKSKASATQPLRAYVVNKGLDRQVNPNAVSSYSTPEENGEVVGEGRIGYEICV